MKSIRRAGNDQHPEHDRAKDDLQGPFAWWRCMKKCGPVFLDPSILSGVLVQARLDPELQIALILLVEGNEPKRLLVGRQGAQHLRAPQYRSPVAEEHQTGPRVRIQRSTQAEHAAARRNDLQIT